MEAIKNDLNEIVFQINRVIPDAKIYLFGSYAKGEENEDSDIDLCVVAPNFDEHRLDVIYALQDVILDKTRLPVDILAYTEEEFESRSVLKSTIQHTIKHKGVQLYG